MRMRAAQDLAMEGARGQHVVRVDRAARDLGRSVDFRKGFANDVQMISRPHLLGRVRVGGIAHLMRSAANSMASRIFVYPVQRHRLPASASRISSRDGLRLLSSSDFDASKMPGVQ